MPTREEAKSIAEAALAGDASVDGVSQVLSWDEISSRKPTLLFNTVDWENCWVAYAKYRDWGVLRSSTIVAIDKVSGRVLYQGGAGDEG
jgi:hypothetical protein